MLLSQSEALDVANPPSDATPLRLPIPPEPHERRAEMRALIEESPSAGLARIADGEWIAGPLWERWRATLEPRGLAWFQFLLVVAGYQNELRLWVVGERTWEHCIEGLIGRVVRRLP